MIYERLREKYKNKNDCVYLEEVADGTGSLIKRYADALVFWIWPSGGYEIEGFEIKHSKQDLDKELQDPTKWEAVGQYCSRWWLAVEDKSIVNLDRLPPMWGVIYPTKEQTKILRPASLLTPKPPTHKFMASLIRGYKKADDVILAREYEKGIAQGKTIGSDNYLVNNKVKMLQDSIAKFEQQSGIKINEYNGDIIGNQE